VAEDIEASQNTPTATETQESAVVFDVTVQIQQPLEEIPGGSAIFFEFKHRKSKKESSKCFCFMEMDEIKHGKTYLEMLVDCDINITKHMCRDQTRCYAVLCCSSGALYLFTDIRSLQTSGGKSCPFSQRNHFTFT
jgi:hypothetical protein